MLDGMAISGDRTRSVRGDLRRAVGGRWRGVVAALAAAAASTVVARFVPFASAVILAVLGGILVGSSIPRSWWPGLAWAARSLLRVGVVLLGFQLSVAGVMTLGAPAVVAIVATVLLGLGVTILSGRLLGVPRSTTLLVATGCSICGASAVAALGGAIRARSEEIAVAVALVTLFGTGAIFVIPWLAGLLGLDDPAMGAWAGISVHEVAQVVAASAPAGAGALTVAVVVKLTRVILLAPIVAVAAAASRRAGRPAETDLATSRPPLVPVFVVLFAGAVVARSLGVVPDAVAGASPPVTTFLLTAALFALGTGVRVRSLLREGRRSILLGAIASVTVAGGGLVALAVAGAL